MAAPTRFLTTAIDYTNAPPHIGHAYEKILTDVLARHHRLCGRQTYFLTGVDQHGQKVAQSADKEGISPREFADRNTEKFLALYRKLGISNDGWAATTDGRHVRVVQAALQRLFDCGQIYKAAYEGFYSVRAEQFLTDKERGPDGEYGLEWGEVVPLREENYYFKLDREWLLRFLVEFPENIFPTYRRADVMQATHKISGDLCISRPKERLNWGIELPFDRSFVTYVWFDALMNYVSFAGWLADEVNAAPEVRATLPNFADLWPACAQVIGKDILVPAHGIYWPLMLHGLGFRDEEMPKLVVHGWWNVSGEKMSKSTGNVVDPDALANKYGVTALRYYLMRDMATGSDADFSEERLIGRYNSDLANGLGNLLNRTLNMSSRYRGARLSRGGSAAEADEIRGLNEVVLEAVSEYGFQMDHFQPHAALEALWAIVNAANGLVETSAPFKLAKLTDDSAAQARLDAVLYVLADSLRVIALLIEPVLPDASAAMLAQLNVSVPTGNRLESALRDGLAEGHQLNAPTPLFPRIEV